MVALRPSAVVSTQPDEQMPMFTAQQVESPDLYFFHMQKTGGTTLSSFLNQHYAESECAPHGFLVNQNSNNFRENPKESPELIRATAKFRLIANDHYPNPIDVLDLFSSCGRSYVTTTILRHPVERLVSHIGHWRRTETVSYEKLSPKLAEVIKAAKSLSLDEFLSALDGTGFSRLANLQAKSLAGLSSSGLEELKSSPSELEMRALNQMFKFDLVGLTEYYSSYIQLLCGHLGWIKPQAMLPLNTGVPNPELGEVDWRKYRDLFSIDLAIYQAAKQRFVELTQKHNLDLPLRCLLAPGTSFHYTMDQALMGQGWLERETTPSGSARWIGPEPRAVIYFPITSKTSKRIQIFLISIIHADALNSLQVIFNGLALQHSVRVADGYTIVEAEAASEASRVFSSGQGMSELTLRSAKAYSAWEEHGVADYRSKTLAVEKIIIESSE